MSLAYGAEVYAYDAATFQSHNPSAPPSICAVERVAHGEDPPIALDTLGLALVHSGAMVMRGAESGPCAIMQAKWPPQPITAL